MRCVDLLKSASDALKLGVLFGALGAVTAMAATYTVDATSADGAPLYYTVVTANGGQSQSCKPATSSTKYNNNTATNKTFRFYTSKRCNELDQLASISGAELFATGATSTTITVNDDGTWKAASMAPGAQQPGENTGTKPGSGTTSGKVLAFFTPWSNTNAILYVDGDSTAIMQSMKNYCGWFYTRINPTANGYKVYFRQTVGRNYIGSEGMTITEPTIATEISLDSVATLSDTIWVQGFKNDVPTVYSRYPGVLGDCPLKKMPVTMFDWLHGNKGDGVNGNGNPENGVSADFGSGGCGGSNNSKGFMEGMVEKNLGANGVPVPATPFPEKCKLSDHLASWFLPEVVETVNGQQYTNMTCRDLYISMDSEGFWLAEVSSSKISEGNEKNKGGMFLLDDFQYLDDAMTIRNPYYDQLSGSGGTHNFGFTMKVQATFEYVKGQYFDFYGDDDVWVFINNKLAVDIGGQHGQVAGAVDLDTLGLIEGETYPFHIFYVERHTSSSNFRMRTSINLQVDASIFLTSDKRGVAKDYNVWQINKKNKLSCGYDFHDTDLDTTGGPSTYKLTGGNLSEPEILGIGTHYAGIIITSDTTFTIDSTKIVENYTLAPGHYFLEVTLKSDPTQTTKVEIIVPSYAIPSVAFARDDWKVLGKEISGDTLQIGEWAYATYKVNVTFFEDWAQVTNYNKKISLSVTNPNVEIVDSTGKVISYVNLDDKGRASFYIHPNAAVEGVTLIAKGSATSASFWTKLNFKDPPIPHVKNAIIVDRNGDGRADSLYVSYDRALKGQSKLDSVQFSFGESFAITTKYKILDNGTDLVITAENMGKPCSPENCGFGSKQFTGGSTDVFTGSMNSWFTYTENNKSTRFNTEGEPISDGVGPVLLKAVKKKLKDGNRELTITMSEAITDQSRADFVRLFELVCMRSGVKETPENPVQVGGNGSTLMLIYSPSKQDAVVPDNGDLIRYLTEDVITEDLSGNKPHKNNPWVTITGDQDVSNEAPNLIQIDPTDMSNPIIASEETTVPVLITNPNMNAQQVGDSLGVQGNLIEFDISKIMYEETQKDINSLDAFIESRLGSSTSYDTVITAMTEADALDQIFKDIEAGLVGENYKMSEETVAAVLAGTITKENYKTTMPKSDVAIVNDLVTESVEASRDTTITIGSISSTTQEDLFTAIRNGELDKELKKAGISQNLIDRIKDGTLTEYNIDNYRNGTETLVSDTAVVMYYQTRYYSQFGEYVGGAARTIKCSDEDIYGQGGCKQNAGKLFLAWNMRSDEGRIVGTGVYIGRIQMKIKVNGKVIQDQTRDKMMGVRRSK